MKKTIVGVFVVLFALTGFSSPGFGGTDISIGISLPPIVFGGPPDLVVFPGTYIYAAPDVHEDIFFYQGYWWRPWRDNWYRSRHYDRGEYLQSGGRIIRTIIGGVGNGTMTGYLTTRFGAAGGGGKRTNIGTSRSIGRPDTRKAAIMATGMTEDTTTGMTEGTIEEAIEEATTGMTGETIEEATDGMTAEMIEGMIEGTIEEATKGITDEAVEEAAGGRTCSLNKSG